MINQLLVTNFALIENLEMEPQEGLHVLTGETGAGKTILVGALGLLRGNRAQPEYIRRGAETASVEGFFTFSTPPDGWPPDLDLDPAEGIRLRREISARGKNKCYLNGRMVTLQAYQEIAARFFDIHGQNQEQSLLRPERQMAVLDASGREEIAALRDRVRRLYGIRQAIARDLRALEEESRQAEQELSSLRFQVEEIDKHHLQPGEEEELRTESRRLGNQEEIRERTLRVLDSLREPGQVLERLAGAMADLEKLGEYDPRFREWQETVQGAYYELEETARSLSGSGQELEYEPGRLDAVEERLGQIQFLKKKYGTDVEEILRAREEAAARLSRFENREEEIGSLRAGYEAADREYREGCAALHAAREQQAGILSGQINALLRELGLPGARIRIALEPGRESETGTDQVCFLFCPNVGEGFSPLSRIASGGEISRIMLAIKTILAQADDMDTMVFDEVDTGVGGEALVQVARSLHRLARDKQVFCVTHSPQLAAFADLHFRITKGVRDQRTRTSIQSLSETERVAEMARMLGGAGIGSSEEQAARMYASVRKMK